MSRLRLQHLDHLVRAEDVIALREAGPLGRHMPAHHYQPGQDREWRETIASCRTFQMTPWQTSGPENIFTMDITTLSFSKNMAFYVVYGTERLVI